MSRACLSAILGVLLLSGSGPGSAQNASGSNAIMKIVVTSGAGSAPDLIARLLAPKLTEKLHRQIVVENRAGANGSIGAGEVARSAPDGSTLLVSTSGTLTANLSLYPKTATGLIASLTPVTQVAAVDFVVAARKDLNVATMPELLARMKAEPGKISVATGPHGSFPHLAAEMMKQNSKLEFIIVKHQTGPSAATSAAGGHTDLVVETAAVIRPFLDSGRLVALASTGASRDPATPSLPTVAESGLAGYAMFGWIGIVAPKDTSLAIREAIQQAIASGVADPTIRERFAMIQFRPIASSTSDFATFWEQEKQRLGEVIRNGGLSLE